MKKTIYKYNLTELAQQMDASVIPLPTPKDLKWLYVATQPGIGMCAWAEVTVNDGAELIPRTIRIIGTGHPVPDNCTHIGSTIDGAFVWHFYVDDPINKTQKP